MYTGNIAAASNRADFTFTTELVDPDTGDAVDLTGATITVAIREQNAQQACLTASTGNGKVTINSPATDGAFVTAFSPADMKTLRAGQYDIGILALLNTGITYQVLAGNLPIIDGVIDQ